MEVVNCVETYFSCKFETALIATFQFSKLRVASDSISFDLFLIMLFVA